MMPILRHLRTAVAAALLLGTPLSPVLAEEFDAGLLWSGSIVRDRTGRLESCAVVRMFDDDSVVTFALTRSRNFFLVVSNPAFRLPEGGKRMLAYRVDEGAAYPAPADLLARSVIIDLPDDDRTQALLHRGEWLFVQGLFDGGQDVEALGYSLEGAGQSLPKLAGCVDAALAAEQRVAGATTGTTAPAGPPPVAGTADPAPVPAAKPDGVTVDLSTFASEATARSDWEHMKTVFAPLLAGREPVFARRTRSSDGRVFTTVRIPGFADRDEAERFCKALAARRQECRLR